VPTSLDNGQRATRKKLRAIVARVLDRKPLVAEGMTEDWYTERLGKRLL
jgi:hypothetical protein